MTWMIWVEPSVAQENTKWFVKDERDMPIWHTMGIYKGV